MRKAVVTGGSGFIGTHLKGRLREEGFGVLNIDLRVGTDILGSADSIRRFDPLVIFHLAANPSVTESVRDPEACWRTNVTGTQVLADTGYPVVFASTCTVYGEGPYPALESQPPNACSPYAAAKLVAEKLVLDAGGAVLRLGNVYGPGQCSDGEFGIVPILLEAKAAGSVPRLFGYGEAVRDYVHVQDVVEAFLLAAKRGVGGVTNVATGHGTRTLALWNLISDGVAELLPLREGEVIRSVLDVSRARNTLGWEAKIGLAAGIGGML